MKLNDKGFYNPVFKDGISKGLDKKISLNCPAIREYGNRHAGKWGQIRGLYQSWSADETIRYKAASGGITTSLAVYLLEHHIVDAVLQVGLKDGSYMYNELKVSKTREQVVENASSRYAPALIFTDILNILKTGAAKGEKYCFVGKPCDVACIRNLQINYPELKDTVAYTISIFCAGMPSLTATRKAWQLSGRKDDPVILRYRGNGWPGFFTAEWSDGKVFKLSYNESWGKILGRHLGLRCKVCPDGIGLLADISVGDYWATKDGFPDFSESKGKCFVMVRTERGETLFNSAINDGAIVADSIEEDRIQEIQKYQYERRKLTFWRLIPLQLSTGFLLDFRGLSIIKQGLTANWITGMKNLVGAWRRLR